MCVEFPISLFGADVMVDGFFLSKQYNHPVLLRRRAMFTVLTNSYCEIRTAKIYKECSILEKATTELPKSEIQSKGLYMEVVI